VCVLGQTGEPDPSNLTSFAAIYILSARSPAAHFSGNNERDLEAGGACSSAPVAWGKPYGKRNSVMYKRLILLLGTFLFSHVPAPAQTSVPQLVMAQTQVAQHMTGLRTVAARLPTVISQLPQGAQRSSVPVEHLFAGDYEPDVWMAALPPTEEVKTLFFRRSTLQLVQLWGGHLRLDGFTGTLNMQNVQLGPSASGGLQDFRPPRESYPGGPRSVDLYGVSLTFHLGRNARTDHPTQVWRCLSRIARVVLN